MSTTLLAAMQELSKQLNDSWQSTTTGAGSATTLVDSALLAKANDWITDDTWSFLTEEPASSAAIYDERKVSSLDNSSGTLTTLTFAAAPGTGIDYEVHRLFSPSEKRRALVAAARRIYPDVYNEIWNEELVSGNWLNDGSFERWTTSTNLTAWTETTLTATQTTTSPYYKHGLTSCKLDTSAGKITQSITNFDDLKRLQGQYVTFTIQGWSDTASCLRIAVYDGTTRTYSSYHAGDSAWTQDNPRNDNMYVTAQIGYNPTEITFEVYHDVAAGTSYVDDARVIADPRGRLYVGHLGLAKNLPNQVFIEPLYYSSDEDWIQVRDWRLDNGGFLYLPTTVPSDLRLRITGKGVLDFLASGVASTAWTATIAIDQPQLDILVAEAAVYLYTQMSIPNFETGDRKQYQETVNAWIQIRNELIAKSGMKSLPVPIHWGIS